MDQRLKTNNTAHHDKQSAELFKIEVNVLLGYMRHLISKMWFEKSMHFDCNLSVRDANTGVLASSLSRIGYLQAYYVTNLRTNRSAILDLTNSPSTR